MEKEIIYSTVVFSKKGAAPEKKKDPPTIYAKGKSKEAATAPDGRGATCSHFAALAACSGTLCVLLVASVAVIIYLSSAMEEQRGNLGELDAEKQLLVEEMSALSSVTHNLNWTLGVIMRFDAFPVSDFCPDKKCQPCREDWVLFQEKCYLFPSENSPWNTWEGGQRYCHSAAADLVVIDNLHEQEFISNHSRSYYDRYHGYWLGLRKVQDKNWVWVDGRNDTLSYWLMESIAMSPQCGLMMPERKPSASWNPAYCYMRNKFICEADVLLYE
ncbi:clec1b [Pungitius sinensis]